MSKNLSNLSLIASLAVLAAGCTGIWNGRDDAITVAEAHPISVDTQTVTLTIDVDPSTAELSSIDKARIRAFADSYLTSGHGPLTVTSPSGGTDNAVVQGAAADARKHLNEVGVDWAAISGASYRAADGRDKKIILSYTHYVATPSACGIWTGLKSRDYANKRSPNFGCATQNNLAAMVADPRDLIQPADDAPPDAQARIRGIKAYREGEVTASATDSEIKAEVSE